jgi:hypothetical protein
LGFFVLVDSTPHYLRIHARVLAASGKPAPPPPSGLEKVEFEEIRTDSEHFYETLFLKCSSILNRLG